MTSPHPPMTTRAPKYPRRPDGAIARDGLNSGAGEPKVSSGRLICATTAIPAIPMSTMTPTTNGTSTSRPPYCGDQTAVRAGARWFSTMRVAARAAADRPFRRASEAFNGQEDIRHADGAGPAVHDQDSPTKDEVAPPKRGHFHCPGEAGGQVHRSSATSQCIYDAGCTGYPNPTYP